MTSFASDPHSQGRASLRAAIASHLRSRRALTVCARIAGLVGTVLTLVNQGDVLLSGSHSGWLWVKIAMNYLVPFIVSSAGFISASRSPASHPR